MGQGEVMWHGAQVVETGDGGSSEMAEVCGGVTAGKGGGKYSVWCCHHHCQCQ